MSNLSASMPNNFSDHPVTGYGKQPGKPMDNNRQASTSDPIKNQVCSMVKVQQGACCQRSNPSHDQLQPRSKRLDKRRFYGLGNKKCTQTTE